jgi:DNA-binding CsgD family transcriptional regulator
MAGRDCPELPARWLQTARPAFVGRERESAALREAWALASRGFRQVVFVGGEPGVGKSRFVAETVMALQAGRPAVLLGTCESALGAPYQPFVEPLAALDGVLADGTLTLSPGWEAGGEVTDRAVQSLQILTGVVRRDGADDPDDLHDHRFARQLFEAAAQVVMAATRVRPMILVLEDVHWAGDSALQLLRHLVSRTTDSRLLIVATQRTGAADRSGALGGTVAQLYRLDGISRIDLPGLSTDEIADYLVDVAGTARRSVRGPATVLRDLTAGNPFLLREVWRDLTVRGGLSALPRRCRSGCSAHLRRIGDRTGRVEQLTAAAGEIVERHGLVRVRRLLAGSCPARPTATIDGLTARETEVLHLLAAGLRNRRIAGRLAISENTAANHVRSILIKTGAANRTQAAMYASTSELLDARQPEGSAGHRLQ